MDSKAPAVSADAHASTPPEYRAAPAALSAECRSAMSRRHVLWGGRRRRRRRHAGVCVRAAAPAAARPRDPASPRPRAVPAPAPAKWGSEAGGPVAIPATIAMGSVARLWAASAPDFSKFAPTVAFTSGKSSTKVPGRAHALRTPANGPAATPPNLRFLLWTGKPGRRVARNSAGCISVATKTTSTRSATCRTSRPSITTRWYPMTTLRYHDATLPVRITADRLLAVHAGQGPRVGHARLPFRLHAGEYFP